MSAKSSPLVRAATALLAATMLAGTPAASFAASEAAPVVKQVPPSIRVVAAEKRELVETLSVNGTIVAREEAAVGTDLNGLTVIALNADEGDIVKKGDVLAVLDRSMLDTQLAQIEASRAQAEANIAQMRAQIGDAEVGVRQAKEALERAEALQKKGVATEAQRDNAVNALDSAKAKLDSAEKALKATEAQLGVVEAQQQNVLVQISQDRAARAGRRADPCPQRHARRRGHGADRAAVPHRDRRRIRACRDRRRDVLAAAGERHDG